MTGNKVGGPSAANTPQAPANPEPPARPRGPRPAPSQTRMQGGGPPTQALPRPLGQSMGPRAPREALPARAPANAGRPGQALPRPALQPAGPRAPRAPQAVPGASRGGSLTHAVHAMRFADGVQGDALAQQRAMENEYLEWGEKAVAAREKAFGAQGYAIEREAMPSMKDAALPAALGFARGFASSATRSAVTSGVSAAVSHAVSAKAALGAATAGGAAGGVAAYLGENTLQAAMGREAKRANFPTLSPVDATALVPDPHPVQLHVDADGRKHFWRAQVPGERSTAPPAEVDPRTFAELQAQAHKQRAGIERTQALMQGKGLGTLLAPALNGTTGLIRDQLVSLAALRTVGGAFVGGGLASGLAGGASEAILELSKTAPVISRTTIADLRGGTQRAGIFHADRPDPAQRPAQWSDIGGLGNSTWNVGKDMATLASHQFDKGHGMSTTMDVLGRNALSGAVSNVLATGASMALGSPVKAGDHPVTSEPPRNTPAQSFVQGAASRFVWTSGREMLKDLADPLDKRVG